MEFTRRGSLIGLAAAVAGCATRPILGNASLIEPYTDGVEERLYPMEKPFIALYRHGGRTLGFVTAVHGTDRPSPTSRAIARAFELVRPETLVIEGFPTKWGASPEKIVRQTVSKDDPNASSYTRGEALYAASLAVERGVPFWGGEPTDGELALRLEGLGFGRDEVFYASMFGPLVQDLNGGVFTSPADPRFNEAYRRWAKIIGQAYGDRPPPLDPGSFKTWYAKTYGIALEKDSGWSERGGPASPGRAGEIGQAQNILRDRHLFDLMIKLVNSKRRVLVVYGGSHLANHWHALEAAMGRPEIVPPPSA